MAAISYDGVDFATTLGALPRITREITSEVDADSGVVIQERHVITLEWTAVPAAGSTTAQAQAAITTFEAVVEALANDGALIFTDNAGNVAWAYNSAGSANNHACPIGIQITRRSFPWGPAKHLTNDPIRLTFEAVVQPCANSPVTGVGSLVYTTTEEWDISGLVTVSYTGKLCACNGTGAELLLKTIVDVVFTPDARDRFTAQGAVLGPGFRATALSFTALDQDDHCIMFRIVYGGGSPPTGLAATKLELDVGVRIDQNLVTLDLNATYHYRGKHVGSGTTTPLIFGKPLGGQTIIFTGGGFGGFGLGASGGGGSDWQQVYAEAWALAGIDLRPFLPPGAGSIFLKDQPRVVTNTAANTIVSSALFYAPWIWDESILLYDMDVQISIPRPGFGSRRLMHPDVGVDPPRPYCNTSGYDEMRVIFTATIVSRLDYMELPKQLTEDASNVWFVGHRVGGVSKLPNQIRNMPAFQAEGYTTSRVMQEWAVRDPSLVPALKHVQVGSIRRLKTIGAQLVPSLSGGLYEGGLA